MIEFGINIKWSSNRFFPKASIIKNGNYSIGYTNYFNNYTYRLFPYIKIKINK